MSFVLTRQLVYLLNKYKDIKLKLDVIISKLDVIKGIRQNRKQEIDEYKRDQSLASDDFWTLAKPSQSDLERSTNEFGFINYSYTREEIEEFKKNEKDLNDKQNEVKNA